jgi:hypothetical protein
MRILDKIVLNRLISTIANFILGILKIFAPTSIEEIKLPDNEKKRWKPRWKK